MLAPAVTLERICRHLRKPRRDAAASVCVRKFFRQCLTLRQRGLVKGAPAGLGLAVKHARPSDLPRIGSTMAEGRSGAGAGDGAGHEPAARQRRQRTRRRAGGAAGAQGSNRGGEGDGQAGQPARTPARPRGGAPAPLFAALDLGTNNCRLLVAQKLPGGGFRVVDSFSRIVRLGEGLATSGELGTAAMDRTHEALEAIARKLARRPVQRARFVATQACRAARNGQAFLDEVRARTGIAFETITPREEAHLAVAGCGDLIGEGARAALVVDIGGGSTELSFATRVKGGLRVQAWTSLPVGVVTLADRFPEEGHDATSRAHWYGRMHAEALELVRGFHRDGPLARLFGEGRAHIIGTSGAVTSLAGVHLGLERYSRAEVDGLWIGTDDTRAAIRRLLAASPAERAAEPCIGPERADLVLAGAAILEAVLDTWPSQQLRVADRGLREGLILTMMRDDPARAPRGGQPGRSRRKPAGRPASRSPLKPDSQA